MVERLQAYLAARLLKDLMPDLAERKIAGAERDMLAEPRILRRLTMTLTSLHLSSLEPLLAFAADLDLADPKTAEGALNAKYPFDGEFVRGIAAAMRAGVANGTLCDQGGGRLRYSRVFKATGETSSLSADAVLMSAPGPLHKHPNGEIDLCFAEDGSPKFDGRSPGWVGLRSWLATRADRHWRHHAHPLSAARRRDRVPPTLTACAGEREEPRLGSRGSL